jgi:antibiotic biosynthesis monooxygenase (ABM) superfamily enzyme
MKTKTFPKASNNCLMPFIDVRLVLPLLLIGHLCCFLLICFKHSPGLQLWAALPLINGLVTFWLLAKSQNQFLNWNV